MVVKNVYVTLSVSGGSWCRVGYHIPDVFSTVSQGEDRAKVLWEVAEYFKRVLEYGSKTPDIQVELPWA